MLALEYERQKGKDMAKAAKEKAFADQFEHQIQVLFALDPFPLPLAWGLAPLIRRYLALLHLPRCCDVVEPLDVQGIGTAVLQDVNCRVDELQRNIEWLKRNTVRRDTQLDALLQQLQKGEQEGQLKRSNSFYGIFGLSR